MLKTFEDVSNITVLLAIFMFIWSLLGMELFAYKVAFTNDDKVAKDYVPKLYKNGTLIDDKSIQFPDSNFNTFI